MAGMPVRADLFQGWPVTTGAGKTPYPTWTDVGISALPPGAVAELVVTAWLGGTRQEAAE